MTMCAAGLPPPAPTHPTPAATDTPHPRRRPWTLQHTRSAHEDTITVCRYPAQILFPNNPNLPPYFPGGIGDMVFQDYVGLWASWSNDSFLTCNWEVDRENCLANSPFGFIEPLFGGNYTEWARWAEKLDRLAGTSLVSSNVQDCTDDDPLDWVSITEATYSMARNRDTGCSFGQFTIQDSVGEQPAECEGIDPWAKSADLAISDAKDLLAKFHANKSS